MKKSASIIGLCLLVIVSACSGGEEEGNNAQQRGGRGGFGGFGGFGNRGGRVASVEVTPVTRGPIAEQIKSFGNIKAQDVVGVIPQVTNRITRIYVDLGDTVEQGQLMAKIYDATFKDQLTQSEAQVFQAQTAVSRDSAQFERQQSLFDKELATAIDYDNAKAAYESSKAQLKTAQSNLTQSQENFNNTEVRSPVRGVVNSRGFAVGDLASAGQPIFEIANLTGYETRVFLPIQDWKQVRIGQEVDIRVSNEEEANSKGSVSRISPQIDATTGLGEVVISLDQSSSSIFPGVLTETRITVSDKPAAITVPRSALVEAVKTIINPESNSIELDRTFAVFVAQGDSMVERRELELGIEQGDRIEVLSGLRPGERIVTTGQQGLEDGSRVRIAGNRNFQGPPQNQITQEGRQGGAQSFSRQGGNGRGGQGGGRGQARQGGGRGGANSVFANLSDEDRQKLRTMSPEERREFIQKLQQQAADSTSNN